MIDTSTWNFLYKKDYIDGNNCPTNMLYTPLIDLEGTTMCMLWDADHPYQAENKRLSDDLIQYCFARELHHLTIMQKYQWAPRILSVEENRIYIEFSNETINHIVADPNRSLDTECPSWKEQIFNIIQDSLNEGYYKVALYPHCFFIKGGVVKTIDFYSCVGIKEQYIEKKIIDGMIGDSSIDRFKRSEDNGRIDFKKFFEITMTEFLSTTWKDNPFPEFYKRLA